MTLEPLPTLLAVMVVAGATVTPWILRHATPALARTPRLAVVMWSASIVAWLLAVLAIGPMLVWILSGPTMLPGAAGDICQRCLDLANPLAGPWIRTPVPTAVLLSLPSLAVAAIALSAIRSLRRARSATRRSATALLAGATRECVGGEPVWRVPDQRPYAIAFPSHIGIVISNGAIEVLGRGELAAVLAHERAHLTQHHHTIRAWLDALVVPLRWVPLVRAAAAAVPHYLEIAADDAARRHIGTTALASALLKLGEAAAPTLVHDTDAPTVLHAAGPDRIRHLVAPTRVGASSGTASVSLLMLAAVSTAGAIVYLPYLRALATGCA